MSSTPALGVRELRLPGVKWEYGPQLIAPAAAAFDTSRSYRYALSRTWDTAWPPLTWVMLNPSTADAFADDPTIGKCTGFARRCHAGGIVVVNLFAYRATDPAALRLAGDPVGLLNDAFLSWYCQPGWPVVAAWGTRGDLRGRAAAVTAMLAAREVRLLCLGRTRDGHPRHPLYVPWDTAMREYN